MFFTADTHFSHANIIKHAKRPYLNKAEQQICDEAHSDNPSWDQWQAWQDLKLSSETVEKHDEDLIRKWNNKVGKTDRVYHLGDFAWGSVDRIKRLVDRLNGSITLVLGNHDRRIIRNAGGVQNVFKKVVEYLEISVPDQDASKGNRNIILSHYSHTVWNKHHYGSWHLYGHSHGQLKEPKFCSQCGNKLEPTFNCIFCGFIAKGASIDVGVDVHGYTPLSYDDVKKHLSSHAPQTLDQHTLRNLRREDFGDDKHKQKSKEEGQASND